MILIYIFSNCLTNVRILSAFAGKKIVVECSAAFVGKNIVVECSAAYVAEHFVVVFGMLKLVVLTTKILSPF